MAIPEYIIKAAREYCKEHGGREALYEAFIAGHKATKQPRSKNISLDSVSEQSFEDCWTAYNRKGNKSAAKLAWSKLSAEEIARVLPHVKAYVGSREVKYQKDFERYLRDKIFNTVIRKGNDVVFDPEQLLQQGEYHPLTDGIFQWWDEKAGKLMFNGNLSMLNDGYTDETRPDGAKVGWQMYSWVWSSQRREWVKE